MLENSKSRWSWESGAPSSIFIKRGSYTLNALTRAIRWLAHSKGLTTHGV